jgi:hypothetical protein
MVARRLAASAKNLVTVNVKQTESATGILVTETGTGIGIGTGIGTGTGTGTATVTATTATANGKGTGTEIMTVTVTEIAAATVSGIENVSAIVRRIETVAPGTTGTTTTHDGHRVTMDVIVNEIEKVTRRGTVVTETETEIDMLHEDQVRERTTGNGVQEGTKKTEEAMMTLERSERQKTKSEVRKCVVFSCLSPSQVFLTAMYRGQNTILKPFQPRTERVVLKHRRRERYDGLTLSVIPLFKSH